jgi:hypothetical protein
MRIARVCEQPREDSLSVFCQRSGFASVLGGVSMVLERRGRWRWLSAGVEKEARTGFPDAGASIVLACEERWR